MFSSSWYMSLRISLSFLDNLVLMYSIYYKESIAKKNLNFRFKMQASSNIHGKTNRRG